MGEFETAVFGGGCFWCTEAVFSALRGVTSVVPGYAGGTKTHPTYEEVCTGTTGHAEVVRILFDPRVISFETLLDIFFHTHDPTTRDRQGEDVGPQYRSIIFYADMRQQAAARHAVEELAGSGAFGHAIVTEIVPLGVFFEAEGCHHGYFGREPERPYCQAVVGPKVAHFRERYRSLLKA